MVDKISFRNYKIFKEKQSIELKPITVIIGKNNSGKSAIAKLPTLLEGALNSNLPDALSITNGNIQLGAELRDLVYGKALRLIEFEIYANGNSDSPTALSVGIGITSNKAKQSAKIEYWKLNDEIDLHEKGDSNIYNDLITNQDFRCAFEGIVLSYYTNPSHESSGTVLRQNIDLHTDFIGPIRIMPNRDYRLGQQQTTDQSGIYGENTYINLITDAITTDKLLLNEVSKWYKTNFEGWEIKINQDKAPIYQIEIHRDGLKQNILDAGIGMSQVLPIITRAFQTCEKETLIIIEEPETHLHPGAHGNLAELFVDTLSQKNKKYLIETHSLNFVLRLRRLIAEKKISLEKLALYYVDFDEAKNYSILKSIEIDEFGGTTNWPSGVFNETLEETIGIRHAQLANPLYDN